MGRVRAFATLCVTLRVRAMRRPVAVAMIAAVRMRLPGRVGGAHLFPVGRLFRIVPENLEPRHGVAEARPVGQAARDAGWKGRIGEARNRQEQMPQTIQILPGHRQRERLPRPLRRSAVSAANV